MSFPFVAFAIVATAEANAAQRAEVKVEQMVTPQIADAATPAGDQVVATTSDNDSDDTVILAEPVGDTTHIKHICMCRYLYVSIHANI